MNAVQNPRRSVDYTGRQLGGNEALQIFANFRKTQDGGQY